MYTNLSQSAQDRVVNKTDNNLYLYGSCDWIHIFFSESKCSNIYFTYPHNNPEKYVVNKISNKKM